MLATLVIGLREGLEASLIVGIIAAFLRRTGKPLRPMWIGVSIAITLSIAVGVILQLVSASLPQAAQEGMESIIGLVAVTIVTSMIGWMSQHARNMRKELEQQAAEALRDGTAWALVGMAFLAVLKEGFETSVFLLAAFQSSTSVLAASAGAVLGVLIAVAIGIGIFRGGVRLNLGRFFKITGIFLVFVAAGLVLSALRTAHEAGWINIGQQQVLDLSWLAPSGSIQAALLTGVLGIPADPRGIEVLGWLAYLIPTLAYLLWPVKARPSGRALEVFRVSLAAGLVVVAAALALAVPLPSFSPATHVAVAGANDERGTLTLTGDGSTLVSTVSLKTDGGPMRINAKKSVATTLHDGVPAQAYTTHIDSNASDEPTSITLTQLLSLNGGRLPIGINPTSNPGPFTAAWVRSTRTTVWISNGGFVDASSESTTIATLSGGGLVSSRTLTPAAAQYPNWRMTQKARDAAATGIARAQSDTNEALLWKLWLPIAMVLAALVLCAYVLRSYRKLSRPVSTATPTRNPKENYA